MRSRLQLIRAAAAALMLWPAAAHAQLETFVAAVRELADAAGRPEPSRSEGVRAASGRMEAALAEWDRTIRALESQADRERRSAADPRAPDRRSPGEGGYQLHVELGVAYRTRGRLVEALRELDAAAALKPSSSDLQLLRALTLEAAGRPDDAGKAFRAAWTVDARDPMKAYYVAQRPATGTAADRSRARATLTEAYRRLVSDAAPAAAPPFMTLDAIPDNLSRLPVAADDATAEGFGLLIAGKYSDAVAALRRDGLNTFPDRRDDSPRAHLARGQQDEAQNRVAHARTEYRAA